MNTYSLIFLVAFACLSESFLENKGLEEIYQFDGSVWAIENYDDKNLVVLLSNKLVLFNIEKRQEEIIVEFEDQITEYKSHNEIIVDDVLPEFPGKEIVFKGNDYTPLGQLWSFIPKVKVVYRDGNKWQKEDIGYCDWTFSVGQIKHQTKSKEILCGEEGDVLDHGRLRIYNRTKNGWQDNVVFSAEVPMQISVIEYYPTEKRSEIIYMTEMGPTYLITLQEDKLEHLSMKSQVIWNDFKNAGWTLKAKKKSEEIFYATRYSNSIKFSASISAPPRIIFKGKVADNTLDAEIISLDYLADLTGKKYFLLASDGAGHIYMLHNKNGQWESKTIELKESRVLSIVMRKNQSYMATENGKILATSSKW